MADPQNETTMREYLLPFAELLCEMAPYLLLGFLIAGILHAFVPRRLYAGYLSGSGFRSVAWAALFGVPLPLCSCGVIPTAMSMRRQGASRAATVSFLISTPQTGVDSILATGSLLGWPLALIRPIAAFATALAGGFLTGRLTGGSEPAPAATAAEQAHPRTLGEKCRAALRYGFVDMMQDIGRWLTLGLLAAGLITVLLPDGFFAAFASRPLLGMLAVLICSIPMYLCATGSIPIAAALMLKGLSPGAALVLLMAGPATNLAAILVIGKVLGRKTLLVYLATIAAGAVGFGLAIDRLLPAAWFSPVGSGHAVCCAGPALAWWKIASGILFVLLLIAALLSKHRKTSKTMKTTADYKIKGMMCNHCKANVERNLAALPGVKSVVVDLAQGIACVEGDADPQTVVATIRQLGYEYVG